MHANYVSGAFLMQSRICCTQKHLTIMCMPYCMPYSVTSADSGSCTRNGRARLIGGGVPSEGIVQVCLNGTWAGVCAEISEEAAKVICMQFSPYGFMKGT